MIRGNGGQETALQYMLFFINSMLDNKYFLEFLLFDFSPIIGLYWFLFFSRKLEERNKATSSDSTK